MSPELLGLLNRKETISRHFEIIHLHERPEGGELTATANSGIGSGNLYSAALQIWFPKEEEEGWNGSLRVGERRVCCRALEGLEKKHGGEVGLWSAKRGGRRWKAGTVVHAIFIFSPGLAKASSKGLSTHLLFAPHKFWDTPTGLHGCHLRNYVTINFKGIDEFSYRPEYLLFSTPFSVNAINSNACVSWMCLQEFITWILIYFN